MSTSEARVELISLDHGRIICGCTGCRKVWQTTLTGGIVCPQCGLTRDFAELWREYAKPSPPIDAPQLHRTAMTVVLIGVISVWALSLCAQLAMSP